MFPWFPNRNSRQFYAIIPEENRVASGQNKEKGTDFARVLFFRWNGRGGKKRKKRIFKVTLLFEALFFPRRFKRERERENSKDN